MSITSYSQTLLGDGQTVRVVVTSDLVDVVGFHWYLDGIWIGSTAIGQFDFYLGASTQGWLDVLDTNDPDFDPIANAPPGYPARRTLYWVRSIDAAIDYYRVEEQKNSGTWSTLGIVEGSGSAWVYTYVTGRLDDLTDYAWRIMPIGIDGEEGTPITIGPEEVVRIPDAPEFTATFDPNTLKITIAAA